MGAIKQITAPVRGLFRFPLFQLAVVLAVILFLQAADPATPFGRIFTGLDKLVEATVGLFAVTFDIRSFTRAWLTSGFWIAYVYLVLLVILWLLRLAVMWLVDLIARTNVLWLRSTIAHERGVAAYRAWEPFERIRPANIPQQVWEETYAWPADNRPPYRPLAQRIAIGGLINVAVVAALLVLIQVATPFPILTWLASLFRGPR